MFEFFFYTSVVIIITGLLILALVCASIIAFFFVRVPFAKTPQKNVKLIIDQLNLKPGNIFYDLGCGDGRFLIEAEKKGVKAYGFEISPWAYLRGQINLFFHKSQTKIFYKNFYNADLKDADVIFCFLMDKVMSNVEEKLKKELKPKALVVSYCFKMPNWQPIKTININKNDNKASKVYLYSKISFQQNK